MKKIFAIVLSVVILACFLGVTVWAEEAESAMAPEDETVAEEVEEAETEQPIEDKVAEAISILESLTPEQMAVIQAQIIGVAEATSKLTGWDAFGEFVKTYITPISWIVAIIEIIWLVRISKQGNDTLNGNASKITKVAAAIADDANRNNDKANKQAEEVVNNLSTFCAKAEDVLTSVHAQADEVRARNAQIVQICDKVTSDAEASKQANLLFAECLNELLQHSKLSETRKDAIQYKFDQGVALLKDGEAHDSSI